MPNYILEYFEGSIPQYFTCQADDLDHAVEQCLSAYPDAAIRNAAILEWNKYYGRAMKAY